MTDSPQQNSGGKHASRTQAIGEPTSDGLKDCITDQEGAGERSQLDVGQVEFRGDGVTGNRDVDAVDVGDGTQKKQTEDEEPADACGALFRHSSPSAHRSRCILSEGERVTLLLL